MAIKELLTDLACKNATAEDSKIRKLHDGQGLYLWVYEDGCPANDPISITFQAISSSYSHQNFLV